MIELMLKDPTVWHWWFFLRGHRFTENENVDEHWPKFREALDSAVDWAGGWKKSRVNRIEDLDPLQPIPSQFVNIPWNPSKSLMHSLQARSLLDTTYIQSAWAQQGLTSPEAFSQLKEAEWEGAPTDLEKAICLMAEVPRSTNEKKAKEVIAKILSCWHHANVDVEDITLIELSCGFYASPSNIQDVVWVMLVWDEVLARQQAEYLVNRLAPPFQLAWLKGRHIRRIYDNRYAPEANIRESDLEDKLERAITLARRLKTIEEHTFEILAAQEKLEEVIGNCEEVLFTLKVNKENLEKLLTDPVYGPGQASMDLRLVAPLRQSIEQIETDMNYKTLARKRADKVLKRFEVATEILSERLTRQITYLLSLFAIFGAIQAFEGEVKWFWKNALFVLLGVIIMLACFAWLRRNH